MNQALAIRRFILDDLKLSSSKGSLEEFTCHVFEKLRARFESMTVFESLKVGARLDIGCADVQN
jgi:hypothetical protein